MDNQREHYRYILLFYFRKGKKAVKARKKLYDVYGEDCFIERQCQCWFARFRSGNFNEQDMHRTVRPTTIDDDKINKGVNRKLTGV